MKTIYKYELKTDYTIIELPERSVILTVQVQNKIPCLWVLLNPDNPKVKRTFKIIGTGWEIDENITRADYIGTWQAGAYVWHLFEI